MMLEVTGRGACYILKDARFVVVGDYLSPSTAGTVEGSVLSALYAVEGMLAADEAEEEGREPFQAQPE
jgi:hypothetical protein